jgi:hypothetical protein
VVGHPENGCVLAAFIDVIRSRGTFSERKLRNVHASIDADALWCDVGEIIDDIEKGRYR